MGILELRGEGLLQEGWGGARLAGYVAGSSAERNPASRGEGWLVSLGVGTPQVSSACPLAGTQSIALQQHHLELPS